MLVSRTVEDNMRPLGLEHLPYALGIANIANAWAHVGANPVVAQFAIDLEQRVLRPLEQYEPIGAESHRLPADFRTDAAAGAGHEDPFAGKKTLQFRCIQINRGAAQKVLKANGIARECAPRVSSARTNAQSIEKTKHISLIGRSCIG